MPPGRHTSVASPQQGWPQKFGQQYAEKIPAKIQIDTQALQSVRFFPQANPSLTSMTLSQFAN